MTLAKISLFVLLGAIFSLGSAQRCLNELRSGADAAYLEAPATGRDAAIYLERAVDLLEPALPPLIQVRGGPLPESDPLAGTLEFLAERELLPMGWKPDRLSEETWRFMIGAFAAWYGVTVPELPEGPLTRGDITRELAELIDRAAQGLEPVALVASAEDDPDSIAFWSVIRNDSIYPRMIVVRPPGPEVSLADGVRSALPALSNCALSVRNYVFTNAGTAQKLFLTTSEAQMVIVQREPAMEGELEYVSSGQETAYFTFADPSLAGVASYAALFVGPGVPLMTLLRIIPQLRTNMSPREIMDFVSAP